MRTSTFWAARISSLREEEAGKISWGLGVAKTGHSPDAFLSPFRVDTLASHTGCRRPIFLEVRNLFRRTFPFAKTTCSLHKDLVICWYFNFSWVRRLIMRLLGENSALIRVYSGYGVSSKVLTVITDLI